MVCPYERKTTRYHNLERSIYAGFTTAISQALPTFARWSTPLMIYDSTTSLTLSSRAFSSTLPARPHLRV